MTFPLQLPTGLVGALLGAPILVLLLNRKVRSAMMTLDEVSYEVTGTTLLQPLTSNWASRR